ncbi:hypothetical protein HMPREF0307_00767 [Corynebacterium sp. DNF00584]|nr:hypothetical protein HMPREF0307_00767 [Corynebacterium sp. DNF00584]
MWIKGGFLGYRQILWKTVNRTARRSMDDLADTSLTRSFCKSNRSADIQLCVADRVLHRTAYINLGSKMEDDFGLVLGYDVVDVHGQQVILNECQICCTFVLCQVVQGTAAEIVDHDDIVTFRDE